ncbi:MAG: flagellar M-ring protein FliF C-terminal domain-containing protein [Candidatus Neomarinimicrobiota bacterium]
MKKVNNNNMRSIAGLLVMATLLYAQGSGYLTQKLMFENDIRSRVKDALSKVIDSHKYVINVNVELNILDEVNEQITVFAPRETEKKDEGQISPAEKTAEALARIQDKMINDTPSQNKSYSIGLPIPGFEVDVTRKNTESAPLTESNPISPRTMQPIDETSDDVEEEKEVIDKVLSRKRPSRAVVEKMELALILQEGAAPELIENIRQLTMAASKFDRERGDKLTIMTASFKERRDQKSAEQIMLKNIAEKIDKLEQKRVNESSDWREDIENYKEEITQRREEDLKLLENQLEELDKKRLQEAADYEKKELARKDSIRNSKLETEISALKEMLELNESKEETKAEELDSTRFAMLDNELQSLRKMLLQAMLQDSIEAQRQAQSRIEAELESREKEKAERDSLIAEKIAALDAVQADLDALEEEAATGMDTKTIMIIALGVVVVALAVMMIMQKKPIAQQQAYPPIPPYPYPPPRRRRRKKRPKKEEEPAKVEKVVEPVAVADDVPEIKKEPVADDVPSANNPDKENGAELEEVDDGDHLSLQDDPNVLKSEIDDIRKSIVSMSVGQPGRTSTIVKEWLEQPAPEAPAATEDSSSDDDSGGEEESDE